MYNIKTKLNGYNYLCLRCYEFSKLPQMCILCRGVLCLKCISIHEKCARCDCKYLSHMSMSLLYIYDKLSINCETCNLEFPLRQIQKHQKICQKEQNQVCRFSNISGLLKNQEKYNQNIQFKFQSNKHFNQIVDHVNEEEIIYLLNFELKCLSCQQKGNYFQMLNHTNQCKLVEVSFQCNQNYQRYQYSEHIQSCLAKQIEQKQSELNTNLKYLLCHIEQQDDDIAYIVEEIYDDVQLTNCTHSQLEDDSDQ